MTAEQQIANARPALNAWRPEKTARMLSLYDANPTREGIAEIAGQFGVGVPTIRARLNTLGRYQRQPYGVGGEHRVEPVTRAKWPSGALGAIVTAPLLVGSFGGKRRRAKLAYQFVHGNIIA